MKYFLLFIVLLLQACHKPSTEEAAFIKALNMKFPEYQFTSGEEPSGEYLNLQLNSMDVDTAMIEDIFERTILSVQDNRAIGWEYLRVLDESGGYNFTVSLENEGYVILEE